MAIATAVMIREIGSLMFSPFHGPFHGPLQGLSHGLLGIFSMLQTLRQLLAALWGRGNHAPGFERRMHVLELQAARIETVVFPASNISWLSYQSRKGTGRCDRHTFYRLPGLSCVGFRVVASFYCFPYGIRCQMRS